MPTYRITGPDGAEYDIEVPSGTSERKAIEVFNQSMGIGEAKEGVSGFVRGLRDPIDAGAQLLERALPESVVSGINTLNDWLAERGLPLETLGEGGLQGQLERLESDYQARRRAEGETGMDWDRLGGQVVTGLAGAAASGPSLATGLAGRMAAGTGGGVVGGALSEPVTGARAEDFWTEKGKQAALGGLTGGVVSGAGNVLREVGQHARSPQVQAMREMGVTPTVGQTMGGAASRMEEKFASLPYVGDTVIAARQRAMEEFNTGTINQALAPLGRTVTESGFDGVRQAQGIIDEAYEASRNIIQGFPLDAQTGEEIAGLRALLKGAPEQVEKDFERFFRQVFERRKGEAVGFEISNFKKLDADIGKKIRGSQGESKDAYMELQSILRRNAARASPEYAAAQQAADAAFSRMVRVEEAAKRAGKQDGVFTPYQLMMGARTADTSSRKRAYAGGEAQMQNTARLAEQVLGNEVPNSGTADRLMAALALMGGGGAAASAFLDPTMIAPVLLGGGSLLLGKAGSGKLPQETINAILRQTPDVSVPFAPGVMSGIGGAELYEQY